MHFNNLPNGMVLKSEALSSLSTDGIVAIRKLGKHEEGVCDCRGTTVFLNGNNISFSGDLPPRTLNSRLVSGENPETREFAFDPMEMVRQDRGAYVAAAITIVRAFMAAKSPRPKKEEMNVVAGYEEWSRYVQQPLIWLGMDDPFGNINEMRSVDPTEGELQRLIDVLKKHFGKGQFTVSDCRELAEGRQDLRDLMTFHGSVNVKSFGRLLSRHLERVRGGWQIVTESKEGDRVLRYRLIGPKAEDEAEEPL
jgi:putative DNA primase/helicase